MLGLQLAVAGSSFGAANAAIDSEDANAAPDAAAAAPAEPNEAGEPANVGEDAVSVPRKRISPLDRRVALLARELGLDAAQKVKVKAVLEGQREQVARVWRDAAVPPAVRVSRTQAIGDRTADQIRALLNEEQRKKYIQPRQRDVAVGTAGSDVQSWMKTGKQPKATP